ncbi:twin transmembrane helix small protein [Rhizobiaceae bacterium n13]|uniref:Twin transmembrane helix small protein n=1 Tax=Ferirhizobium litorale TaxID=2927786 RepID=A0AAE3U463_9HYPH|nr:twin transmembrane helix small protein [Fererhizobium litorale]MDI7864350.1 twin transmembrane helix small protein [Fererhizobium litorale]MDI7924552.1 twin transmembrane helix small protein [Fererhizobium litorale]
MSSFTTILTIIVLALIVLVLVRGLYNLLKGSNPHLSNRLMQMRILLQAIAIVLIMLTLWLTGGGR